MNNATEHVAMVLENDRGQVENFRALWSEFFSGYQPPATARTQGEILWHAWHDYAKCMQRAREQTTEDVMQTGRAPLWLRSIVAHKVADVDWAGVALRLMHERDRELIEAYQEWYRTAPVDADPPV